MVVTATYCNRLTIWPATALFHDYQGIIRTVQHPFGQLTAQGIGGDDVSFQWESIDTVIPNRLQTIGLFDYLSDSEEPYSSVLMIPQLTNGTGTNPDETISSVAGTFPANQRR